MLWIMLLVSILTVYFIFVKWNNIYNAVFLLGTIANITMIFAFVLGINVVSSMSISLRIDYFLYRIIRNLNINVYDIKLVVNCSIVLFLLSVNMLCTKNDMLFYKNKKIMYGLLFTISSLLVFWLNSESFGERMYIALCENSYGSGEIFLMKTISFFSDGIIFFHCVLPAVNMILNIKETKIIFRKKYFFSILIAQMTVSCGMLVFLYLTPLKFFYNNFDLYNFDVLYMMSYYNKYLVYISIVVLFLLTGLILLLKYNVLEKKKFFGQMFNNNSKNLNIDEIRHVFHTCKNAMFSISAMSDMVLSKDNIDDMKIFVNKIKKCANNYAQHVGKFLDISGNTKAMNDLFRLSECVLNATNIVMIPSNIKIVTDIKTDDDLISGNLQEITEVFSNLINNAVDAINKKRKEGGLITISVWNEEKLVCVNVCDNGTGMSRKYIKKIFVPFYTTTMSNRNWGLGLSHAKSIVERHGGVIDVVSKLGVYTKFQLVIPTANVE